GLSATFENEPQRPVDRQHGNARTASFWFCLPQSFPSLPTSPLSSRSSLPHPTSRIPHLTSHCQHTTPAHPTVNRIMDKVMEGFVSGVKQVWAWVSNPFEFCCCPGRRADDDDNGKSGDEEDDIDLWHKDNNGVTTCVTTSAEGRVIVRGGLKKKNGKTGRLTAESLRSLNAAGLSECGGRRPATSHSSGETLDNSSQHSSSSSNAVGTRTRRKGSCGAGKIPSRGVQFSSGVDVIAEWDRHLARVNREDDAEDSRGRATITLGGDDIVSAAEDDAMGTRRSFAEAPRSISRAARLAIEGSRSGGGGHDTIGRGGKGAGLNGYGQPLMYGMQNIIASGGRGTKGIKGSGAGLWREEEEEEEEEDEAIPTLLDRYDGSLANLKSLVFPPSITDRPAKRLFDAGVLASTSPAKAMTATELDVIFSRLSGWKNGGGSRRRPRRAIRTRKNAGCGGGGGDKSSCGATSREERELRRVSPDNSALSVELYALAKGERRESLLYKRAFLNTEGGSVSSRQ
ncbi:unnamed protein product, partial [Ectocarpus sp. 13 AM-2016]